MAEERMVDSQLGTSSIRIATGGGTDNLQPWTGTRSVAGGKWVGSSAVINPHTVGNNAG